jgi:hypothetical protein
VAYAGLRPEEALALAWTHVRANTLLIERKLVRGELVQGQKTRRTLRTAPCSHRWPRTSPPTRRRPTEAVWCPPPGRRGVARSRLPQLAKARLQSSRRGLRPPRASPIRPATQLASLLIHEGRPLMEIAGQLGHSVETLLRHYAHLIAEMAGQPSLPAEQAIRDARTGSGRPRSARGPRGREEGQRAPGRPHKAPGKRKPPLLPPQKGLVAGSAAEPSGGLEPPTPSLPWKCSTG